MRRKKLASTRAYDVRPGPFWMTSTESERWTRMEIILTRKEMIHCIRLWSRCTKSAALSWYQFTCVNMRVSLHFIYFSVSATIMEIHKKMFQRNRTNSQNSTSTTSQTGRQFNYRLHQPMPWMEIHSAFLFLERKMTHSRKAIFSPWIGESELYVLVHLLHLVSFEYKLPAILLLIHGIISSSRGCLISWEFRTFPSNWKCVTL